MIIDYQNKFSALQALTATAASTNYIDQSVKGDAYDGLFLLVRVGTAFAGGTSVEVQLQSADDAGFTTNLTTHFDSGTIPLAALTANREIVKVVVPYGLRRYIRVNYVVVGTMTAGTVDAFLTPDVRLPAA